MKKILLLVSVILSLFSCGKPLITNTHRGKYGFDTYNNPNYNIPTEQRESPSVSPIVNRVKIVELETKPKEKPEKPLTIDKLEKTVARELISGYNNLSFDGEELVSLVKEPLSIVEKSESQQTDYTKITIRLNFTYINEFLRNPKLYAPNTRIEYLNTTLTPSNDNLIFYDVDKFENIHKLVDIGTLGRTQNVKFGAEASANATASSEITTGNSSGTTSGATNGDVKNEYDSAGHLIGVTTSGTMSGGSSGTTGATKNTMGATGAAKLTYDNTTAITENANLKYDRLSSGYSFDDSHLTVMKRGYPMSEIDNETFVTTTLIFKNVLGKTVVYPATVYIARNLFTAGLPTKADKVLLKSRDIKYNKCTPGISTIALKAKYDGLIRQVENTRFNNAAEYDDKINYLKFENICIEDVTLDLNNYCSRVFKIVVKDSSKKYTLSIKTDTEAEKVMNFFQDDNYTEFITWLTAVSQTNDVNDLITRKYTLKFVCIDEAPDSSDCADIELVNDTMTNEKLQLLKDFLNGKSIVEEEDVK